MISMPVMTARIMATWTKSWNLLSSAAWPGEVRTGVGSLMAGGSNVLEEVDRGEDHDPDDVDEVPVQAHHFDVDGVVLVEGHGARRAGEEAQQGAGERDGDQGDPVIPEPEAHPGPEARR